MLPLLSPTQSRLGLPRGDRGAAARCRCCSSRSSWVSVKMLPFDNKSELQVIIDMPEGTTLETTTRVAREIADYLRHRARGHRPADLRRHRGADQLQRPGASLRPAPGLERRRHPGQPGAQGRARRPEPRHRQAAARAGRGDRGPPRCRGQGRRGAAGTAGAVDPGGRGLRSEPRGAAAGRRSRYATSS